MLLTSITALATIGGAGSPDAPLAPGSSLTGRALDAVLDAQFDSRHLDHVAALAAVAWRGLLHDRVGGP